MELWNKRDLKAPPTYRYTAKAGEVDYHHLGNILADGIRFYEDQQLIQLETQLLARVIYRMKRKFFNSKDFQALEKVKRDLMIFTKMNIVKDLQHLIFVLPKPNGQFQRVVSLPTKNMVDFLLVRLQGIGKILCRCIEMCKLTASLYERRMYLGHFWRMALIAFGLVSRIYILSLNIIKYTCLLYVRVLPFSHKLKNISVDWLPKDYVFPKDLKEWLNIEWSKFDEVIDICDQDFNISLVDLVEESDDEIEFCDEYIEIDEDEDIEIINEYKNITKRKIKPMDFGESVTILRGFSSTHIDTGEVLSSDEEDNHTNKEDATLLTQTSSDETLKTVTEQDSFDLGEEIPDEEDESEEDNLTQNLVTVDKADEEVSSDEDDDEDYGHHVQSITSKDENNASISRQTLVTIDGLVIGEEMSTDDDDNCGKHETIRRIDPSSKQNEGTAEELDLGDELSGEKDDEDEHNNLTASTNEATASSSKQNTAEVLAVDESKSSDEDDNGYGESSIIASGGGSEEDDQEEHNNLITPTNEKKASSSKQNTAEVLVVDESISHDEDDNGYEECSKITSGVGGSEEDYQEEHNNLTTSTSEKKAASSQQNTAEVLVVDESKSDKDDDGYGGQAPLSKNDEKPPVTQESYEEVILSSDEDDYQKNNVKPPGIQEPKRALPSVANETFDKKEVLSSGDEESSKTQEETSKEKSYIEQQTKDLVPTEKVDVPKAKANRKKLEPIIEANIIIPSSDDDSSSSSIQFIEETTSTRKPDFIKDDFIPFNTGNTFKERFPIENKNNISKGISNKFNKKKKARNNLICIKTESESFLQYYLREKKKKENEERLERMESIKKKIMEEEDKHQRTTNKNRKRAQQMRNKYNSKENLSIVEIFETPLHKKHVTKIKDSNYESVLQTPSTSERMVKKKKSKKFSDGIIEISDATLGKKDHTVYTSTPFVKNSNSSVISTRKRKRVNVLDNWDCSNVDALEVPYTPKKKSKNIDDSLPTPKKRKKILKKKLMNNFQNSTPKTSAKKKKKNAGKLFNTSANNSLSSMNDSGSSSLENTISKNSKRKISRNSSVKNKIKLLTKKNKLKTPRKSYENNISVNKKNIVSQNSAGMKKTTRRKKKRQSTNTEQEER